MSVSENENNHLNNTLSELNTAIEQWDTITNKPMSEQELSRNELKKQTKEMFEKLQKQLDTFNSEFSD